MRYRLASPRVCAGIALLVLAGYYRLVSGMLNSVGVALESETPGWPAGAAVRLRAPREEA